jgi:SAM-dependent MidA family methyltransferase
MNLEARLKAQIAADGPMTVAQYMTACLHDPQGGYYATRPRLGADGDFITAPLVSQMFGELLGLWAVETWIRMGQPPRLLLVEAGPGDGTLMSDMLRAVRLAPAFLKAAQLYLIETSAPLIQTQRERLAQSPLQPVWIDSLAALPAGAPMILVANELLDCLPVHQFVRTARGWAERMVGLDSDGALAFGLAARPLDRMLPASEPGSVIEISPAQEAFAAQLGQILAREGGAAVLIDYGRAEWGVGDTLQALKAHRKLHPLETPGEADLTVHADFPAVAAAAEAVGVATALSGQGEFLRRLGIVERAEALSRARPDQAETLQRQLARLIDTDQMGTLFKVLALYSPADVIPPGFEEV